MDKIILINKKIGQTPLQCIEEVRSKKLELSNMKLGYAGRLDPMAEGLLLVMVGEECKAREKYQKMDKEYEADILFGISTDSYDVLGIVTDHIRISHNILTGPARFAQAIARRAARESRFVLAPGIRCGANRESLSRVTRSSLKYLRNPLNIKRKDFQEVISQFKGKIKQKLPPYSAYRIGKNTMYRLAREKKLDLSKLPEKEVEILDIKILGYYEIESVELEKLIPERIQLVKGNFRQEEIIDEWKRYFQRDRHGPIIIGPRDDPTSPDQIRLRGVNKYQIIKLKISCSSGTYIRSLANDIGIKSGIPAMLLNLKRTRIGKYRLKDLEIERSRK